MDIYSDWIDACEELAEEAEEGNVEIEQDEYSDDDEPSFKLKNRPLDSDDEY